jgi:hypothetical protein
MDNSKILNLPFSSHIYNTYIILIEIIMFNCYGVMVTHLTTVVLLYSSNNNTTLKMAVIAAETW